MQRELEKLRTEVFGLAGKYSDPKKRRELEQVFEVLKKELASGQVQSQRLMVLLRAIIYAQPGSTKMVNEFLRSPSIAQAIQSGSGYTME